MRSTSTTTEGPFEAKLVDALYLSALEELVDAVDGVLESGGARGACRAAYLGRLALARGRVADLESRQDRYRTDREVGPRSLARFLPNPDAAKVEGRRTKRRQG